MRSCSVEREENGRRETSKAIGMDMDAVLDYWYHWLLPLERGLHGHWTDQKVNGERTGTTTILETVVLNLIREAGGDGSGGDDYLNYGDGDSEADQDIWKLMKEVDDVGGGSSDRQHHFPRGVKPRWTETRSLNGHQLDSND